MPYYDTIAEDLKRAKDLIEKGSLKEEDIGKTFDAIPHIKKKYLEEAGTIFGADIYPAYRLLKSFVAEIERLQQIEKFLKDVRWDLPPDLVSRANQLLQTPKCPKCKGPKRMWDNGNKIECDAC